MSEKLKKIREALAFAACTIKCGEDWSATCDEIFDGAFAAIGAMQLVEVAALELDNARFAYEATESAAAHQHHRRMQTALSKVLVGLPVEGATWKPTPDAINALPAGVRDHIHALEARSVTTQIEKGYQPEGGAGPKRPPTGGSSIRREGADA